MMNNPPHYREERVRTFFRFFSVPPIPLRFEEFLGVPRGSVKSFPSPKNTTNVYLQKGKKWAFLLRFCPFVRAVSLVNTVSFGVAQSSSDIDLLVVTAPHKIWTARFFVTLFLSFCGVRRTKERIAGKICLSFFVDETVCDFSSLKLPFDPYLAFWCAGMIPVFGKSFFSLFHQKNTKWIGEEVSMPFLFDPQKIPSGGNFLQLLLEKIFYWTEDVIRYFWKQRTLQKRDLLKNPSGTIISDHILKFHDEDKREEWAEKMRIL